MRELDVAIIGAGTAGLSARLEVAKQTDNYLVFDGGPLGTTCARVGCMPSKVLIQVANDYHTRTKFAARGILGAEQIALDDVVLMEHVRSLRDRFVRAVMGSLTHWQETHLVAHFAHLTGPNTVEANGISYQAKKIILATGSRPVRPRAWDHLGDLLSDSDDVFEWKNLPRTLAVVGLGVIGVELGQAFARLGVQVIGISLDSALGGLTDPDLQTYAVKWMNKEFPINTTGVKSFARESAGLKITTGDGQEYQVERALLAMGRRPNLDRLGLSNAGIKLPGTGIPPFDMGTHRIEETDLYIAGDVDGSRPLLHEAADEGWIAGYNSVRKGDSCFARRTPLAITFSEPNIALVGDTFSQLTSQGRDFVSGEVCFEGYGRAIIRLEEKGLLRIYAERNTGQILGAEMFAPAGEHLAHTLAWAIAQNQTVDDALALPFYHPVFEEGLKTALRDCRAKLSLERRPLELFRCQEAGISQA